MDKYKKTTFIGGDRRHAVAARRLAESVKVRVCGIPEDVINDGRIECVSEIDEALGGASVIVLPLPASIDGVHLNSPMDNKISELKLANILKTADKSTLICGGRLPPAFILAAENEGFSVCDYFESEALQIKNAYTTAEAALSIAMNALSKNIRGARIAITGYGRIAKHLSRLLLSLGARVTVAARKDADIAWARSEGCATVSMAEGSEEIYSLSNGYDVIYNTVPSWIFDRKFLENADKNTLIIELASAPGGVDICAAKELGTNIIWALSLPGKYAPDSAGEHIAECVQDIICREGRVL